MEQLNINNTPNPAIESITTLALAEGSGICHDVLVRATEALITGCNKTYAVYDESAKCYTVDACTMLAALAMAEPAVAYMYAEQVLKAMEGQKQ